LLERPDDPLPRRVVLPCVVSPGHTVAAPPAGVRATVGTGET
jgi:hypothetical protein